MCRNIRILFNFEPPATADEIRAAASQFVGKVGGTSKPSNANRAAYDKAVDDISASVSELLASLTTSAKPRNREIEAEKARARAAQRFGRSPV